MSEEQTKTVIKFVDASSLIISSDLKKTKSLLFKTLVYIKSYRGLRKLKGLPVRGQRTHTNSKTVRKIQNASKNWDEQNTFVEKCKDQNDRIGKIYRFKRWLDWFYLKNQ